MSLNFIYYFQLRLHKTLTEDEDLKLKVKNIYLSPVQDGIYPFILIDFLKIDNKSRVIQDIYSIDFEICIFSRSKNKTASLQISDSVNKVVNPDNLTFDDYRVSGIKLNYTVFDEAKDLVHNKLTMNYKSLLKKEIRQ